MNYETELAPVFTDHDPRRHSPADDWVPVAEDIAYRYPVPGLPRLVETAVGNFGAMTCARAACEALKLLDGLPPSDDPWSDKQALRDTLRRIVAASPNPEYVHWSEYARDLRYKGIGFGSICIVGGAPWAILDWLDKALSGCRGSGQSDPNKGHHDGMPILPATLSKRTKKKAGKIGTSARSIQAWIPALFRAGAIVLVRREARGLKVWRTAWYGVEDPEEIREILADVLRRLVEMELARELPRGRSGTRNTEATRKASPNAVRSSCGPGAVLEMAQPIEQESGYGEIDRDMDIDSLKIAYKAEQSTTEVPTSSRGEDLSETREQGPPETGDGETSESRDQGGDGTGSGGGLPPDGELPAYVELLIHKLGEQARPTVEQLSVGLFNAHGGEAVAPMFLDASRQKWGSTLEAVTWVQRQVRGAISRGEIVPADVVREKARQGAA